MDNSDKNAIPVFLSKDMILGADDTVREVVFVKEWGGSVTVKSMSGVERDAFESTINTPITDAETGATTTSRNMENFRARLCAACMVNTNGKLLFPNPEDVVKLGKKNSKALDRVMSVAQKINGIGAKETEELVKN